MQKGDAIFLFIVPLSATYFRWLSFEICLRKLFGKRASPYVLESRFLFFISIYKYSVISYIIDADRLLAKNKYPKRIYTQIL